jgi:hypothetical protein
MYLASGLFSKDLFPANPTIVIDEINPRLEDRQTDASISKTR